MPKEELPGYSSRLGGKITELTQHRLAPPRGKELQVNVVKAASAAEARAIVAHLGRKPGLAGHLLRASRFVVEIVGASPLDQHRITEALDLLDRTERRYRLSLRMALVESGDAGAINRAFNLLLAPRAEDPEWRHRLSTELSGVRFGHSISLRSAPTAAGHPSYSFSPLPASTHKEGLSTRYSFANPPRQHGVPYVDLVAEVRTAGYRPIEDARPDARLTSPTTAWPSAEPRIGSLVDKLVKPGSSERDRLAALHGWTHQSIPQGGAQLGARRGTLATLEVGHGRCWERSDVLVTLLRAAGVPARQVAGWVEGLGGHIWAEAYLPDVGWIGADATAPWLGVSGDYIPLFVTEDGAMTVFYLSAPRIEKEGCREDE
ncbi:MAG: transglutaminase domain-containing protein [Polyangia bacterium]|nr:transglutaminase domain-containing protein [Polyangia bacterium]